MMANKSTKIAVIVLATLLLISALHFAVFRSRATEYKNAKQSFDGIHNELVSLGQPKQWSEIYRFEYQTYNHEIRFLELIRDANLEKSDAFTAVTTTEEEAAREQQKQLMLLWDMLHELQALAKSQDKTKFTFLERPQSWNLLGELPESVRRSGTAISDLMRRLQDTDALLKQIPETQLLYQQKELDYKRQLFTIGLNVLERDRIKQNIGKLPAIYHTLNRIDLVKKESPKEELGGLKTEMDYNLRLWDLFRLEYKELVLYNAYKQMVAVQDLARLAVDKGLSEIRDVRMWDARDIEWPPPELDKSAQAGAPGAAGAMPGAMPGAEFVDPYSAMPGVNPYLEQGGYEGEDFLGFMFGGAAPAAAVAAPKDIVAAAVPIEFTVVGSNSAIISFLYELSHNRRTYSIDAMDLVAMPQQENSVGARVVVQAISYYPGFQSVTNEEMAPTKQRIEEEIVRLLNQKKEIANKAGAMELAQEEGFLDKLDEVPPLPPGVVLTNPATMAGSSPTAGGMGMDPLSGMPY